MFGGVGLVSIRWWELIMQIANTIILFLAIRHFLFQPVTNFMQGRRDEISGNLEDAEKIKAEAEQLKVTYQGKIDSAKEEARQIVKEATQKGEARREEIIKQGQEESKQLMERARVEMSREKAKAMEELKNDMVEISLAAASMVIQKNLDDQTQQKLIQEYIEEMGDVHV